MSIPAISSLIVAVGGKGALPDPGEMRSESGLPLNFAALLAEQIPPTDQAAPAALVTDTIPADQQLDSELFSGAIAQATMAKDSNTLRPIDDQLPASIPVTEDGAAGILAALSASPKQPAAGLAVAEPERKKERDDKDRKAMADAEFAPTDPGQAAQYVIPLATQAVQNRLPDSVDRSKSSIPAQGTKIDSADTPAKEGRPALREQARPVATESTSPQARPAATESASPPLSGAQAAPSAESRIIPRSDTANTAILAGDSNAGNSGNTPAFATALAATGTANTTATPAHQAQPPAIATALNTPNWPQDFGTRVVWLAKNDQQVAQISINPPQLGPVQISISLNGDQASATFASPHPEVRQAIQDSLPQLREMFTSAGISLGQANVGTQLPSQNREAAYQFANQARSSGENAILSPDSHSSSNPNGIPIQRGRGLVDLFA